MLTMGKTVLVLVLLALHCGAVIGTCHSDVFLGPGQRAKIRTRINVLATESSINLNPSLVVNGCGGFLEQADGWNRPIHWQRKEDDTIEIRSAGADGQLRSAADIVMTLRKTGSEYTCVCSRSREASGHVRRCLITNRLEIVSTAMRSSSSSSS